MTDNLNVTSTLVDKLIRPELKELKPYESARRLFSMSGSGETNTVWLNANENPYELPGLEDLNRYPEPQPQASTDVYESETVFDEPEEVYEVQPDTIAPKTKSNSNFVSDAVKPDGMPEFGDTSILNEIDKIASKESTSKPKGKRGRPRKKK